jgi:hypothetical protein
MELANADFRSTPQSRHPAGELAFPKSANIVAKVFLGRRSKFSGTADAFRMRGCEGSHCFVQKSQGTFTSALRGIAAVEASKNPLSRDFRHRLVFDFCNNICQRQTFVLYAMRVSKKKSASGLTIEFIATCSEVTCSPCCLTYSYAACSRSKSG